MKKITIAKKITTVFLLLMMLTAASGVRAQCSRLKFAKGRTTAVINGKVDKSKHACYDLHARDGQRMTVHLTSPGKRARFYSVVDGAFASMLILLAAVDEGLGAVFVGAFDDDEVSQVLGLPTHVRPIGLIAIGHCAERGERLARRGPDEVVHRDRYGIH